MLDPGQANLRLNVYLTEYAKLKSEQVHRIGIRDNIVYAALVATAAVVAFAFDRDGGSIALLVLPVASFVLGWLHTNNDAKSCAIGHYLRHTLSQRISEVTEPEASEHPCILGWEAEVRSGKLRRWRKLTEFVSNMVTFVGPGALALLAYWCWFRKDYGLSVLVMLVMVSILEGGLLVVLGAWIIKEADICWTGSAQVDT